jgi:hypothetical protein
MVDYEEEERRKRKTKKFGLGGYLVSPDFQTPTHPLLKSLFSRQSLSFSFSLLLHDFFSFHRHWHRITSDSLSIQRP